MVLFLFLLFEWIGWPRVRMASPSPRRLTSPCRKERPPLLTLRSDQLHLPFLCLAPLAWSLQISVLWVSGLLVNITFYSLSQRSFLFSGNFLGPRPFLVAQQAGPQTKADPDPVPLSWPLHSPWNYSLQSRMPSSVASEGFPGWMRRPGKRPRTG